jgi:hypothetical protein
MASPVSPKQNYTNLPTYATWVLRLVITTCDIVASGLRHSCFGMPLVCLVILITSVTAGSWVCFSEKQHRRALFGEF